MGNKILKKINPECPESWNQWNTMTKIRRFADENYMIYSKFWSISFEAIIELNFRNTFPNAFLNKRLQTWVVNRYNQQFDEEEKAGYFLPARNPFFEARNYTGHPLQDAYFDHFITLYVKYYGYVAPSKIRDAISNGIIPEEYIKKRAGVG